MFDRLVYVPVQRYMEITNSDGYFAPIYKPVPATLRLHNVPRTGYPSDLSLLASSNPLDRTDYMMGAISISVILMSICLVWTLALIILKCMGKRAGFLHGSNFAIKPVLKELQENDRMNHKKLELSDTAKSNRSRSEHSQLNDVSANQSDSLSNAKKWIKTLYSLLKEISISRPTIIRIAFMICASLVIAYSALLVDNGLKEIEDATVSFSESNLELQDLVMKGNEIVQALVEVGKNTESIRADVLIDISAICPDGDITAYLGDNFQPTLDGLSESLDRLQGFVVGQLQETEQTLERVHVGTEVLDEAIDKYNEYQYRPIYWIPLVVCPSILLIGAICASFDMSPLYFQDFQRYVVFPIFTIWIAFTWLLASGFAIVAVMNADACSGGISPGSPDSTVMNMVDKTDDIEKGSLLYAAIKYYVEGCNGSFPFNFATEYLRKLIDAKAQMEDFMYMVEYYSTVELSNMCGSDISSIVAGVDVLQHSIGVLLENADRTLSLLSCESLNSIYVKATHEGACTHSIAALSWLVLSLVVISICGMTMIMLRSSILHTVYTHSLKHVDDNEIKGKIGFNHEHFENYSPKLGLRAKMLSSASVSTYLNSPSLSPIAFPSDADGSISIREFAKLRKDGSTTKSQRVVARRVMSLAADESTRIKNLSFDGSDSEDHTRDFDQDDVIAYDDVDFNNVDHPCNKDIEDLPSVLVLSETDDISYMSENTLLSTYRKLPQHPTPIPRTVSKKISVPLKKCATPEICVCDQDGIPSTLASVDDYMHLHENEQNCALPHHTLSLVEEEYDGTVTHDTSPSAKSISDSCDGVSLISSDSRHTGNKLSHMMKNIITNVIDAPTMKISKGSQLLSCGEDEPGYGILVKPIIAPPSSQVIATNGKPSTSITPEPSVVISPRDSLLPSCDPDQIQYLTAVQNDIVEVFVFSDIDIDHPMKEEEYVPTKEKADIEQFDTESTEKIVRVIQNHVQDKMKRMCSF